MPSPKFFSPLAVCVCSTAALLCATGLAQVNPANPSFSATADQPLFSYDFTADFGTFRQGSAGATKMFDVFNRSAPTGTTSSMSLTGVAPFGHSTLITLQPGTISALPAGNHASMQLTLNTTQFGNLSAGYILDFKSDQLPPDSSPRQVTITAFAKVLPIGDYDSDGDVDNADFAVWRSAYGSHTAAADGNLNGTVDAADYVLWRNNFTGPLSGDGSGAGLSAPLAVPEPASLSCIVAALAAFACRRRCRRHAA